MLNQNDTDDAHARSNNDESIYQFAEFLLGSQINWVAKDASNGNTIYFESLEHNFPYPAQYTLIAIAKESSREQLQKAISNHPNANLSDPNFRQQVAASGAATQRVDLLEHAIIYFDIQGNEFHRDLFPRS